MILRSCKRVFSTGEDFKSGSKSDRPSSALDFVSGPILCRFARVYVVKKQIPSEWRPDFRGGARKDRAGCAGAAGVAGRPDVLRLSISRPVLGPQCRFQACPPHVPSYIDL
jgi:hypothetical protein